MWTCPGWTSPGWTPCWPGPAPACGDSTRTRPGRRALLVDTRTDRQRREQGELPGALVIDRTVLEWRLDDMIGGVRAWVAAGLPTTTGPADVRL